MSTRPTSRMSLGLMKIVLVSATTLALMEIPRTARLGRSNSFDIHVFWSIWNRGHAICSYFVDLESYKVEYSHVEGEIESGWVTCIRIPRPLQHFSDSISTKFGGGKGGEPSRSVR